MITFCGDPYGLVPCTGCPRCARPPPPPTFHETDTEDHPDYDSDPEEYEPSEADATTEGEETTAVAHEGLMGDDDESSDSSDSSSDSDGATSTGSEDTVQSPITASPKRVVRRRGILRSRAEPYPAPSHRVYREAGGLRWMYTPRKRVPTICQGDVFRFTLPVSTASVPTTSDSIASVSTIPVPPAPAPEIPAPPPPRPDPAVQVQTLTTRQRDADFQIQLLIDELGEAHREIGRLRASELAQNHRIARLELLVSEIQQSRQPPPQL